MSTQIFEALLKEFTKSNKVRREKLAKKHGFASAADYKLHLENTIKGTPIPTLTVSNPDKVAAVELKPTVHNVHILDASGSMSGSKLKNAITGINSEITELKKDDTVNYTQTICHFSNSHDIQFDCIIESIKKIGSFSTYSRGTTALFDAIGITLNKLIGSKLPNEKVLVKIFTDGEENASHIYSASTIAKLIKEVEQQGFTVTFVGTQSDVDFVTRQLSIDASNTLVHDNTAKGVFDSFTRSSVATQEYATKLKAGEDVTKGFYKKVGTL